MMDKYAKGSTARLVQSFDGGPLKNFNDAVTYDDALFVDALLARGPPEILHEQRSSAVHSSTCKRAIKPATAVSALRMLRGP